MKSVTFSFRTETALFSLAFGGLPLREQAFKGAMRYWYRAFCASAYNLKSLAHKESQIFGSSGRQGQATRGVRLQLIRPNVLPQEISPQPHKERVKPLRALPARHEFQLVLSQPHSMRDEDFLKACAALWLAATIGGFGRRSRRGAGGVRVISISGSYQLNLPVIHQQWSSDELKNALSAGLIEARKILFEGGKNIETPNQLRGDIPQLVSGKDGSHIIISDLGPSSEAEARAKLMLKLRQFKNQIFGLPLKINQGENGAQAERKERFSREGSKRYASPVWIRLIELKSGWTMIVTLLLPLPRVKTANRDKLDEFLAALKQNRKEVAIP
ncbi:type III-B CRISPR module RAMP protein Cmr1 [bacterium]|nr:type III-B CRISPR module RAMP protein Cmr1 [bacterium]